MSDRKKPSLLIPGILFVLLAAWLVRKRLKEGDSLPAWQKALAESRGAEKAQQLTAAVRREYAALLAGTALPQVPALRTHLKGNILPGLALYRVLLQEHGGDKAAALAEVDRVFRPWVLARSRIRLAPLHIFPAPFRLFRLVLGPFMKQFPREGWDFTPVENSGRRVAFNATRCYYLKTLTDLGAPELTASFCKTDDVMAECFPPSICFVREHTLGRGDEVCDFQYCRVD